MADPKKDSKTDTAEGAHSVDPRDAQLKKLEAEIARLSKAKGDSDRAAADAADYAKALEAELKQASKAKGDGPETLITTLIEGQNKLTEAVAALVKGQTPEMMRHADILVDGKVPLAPEHRGTKKYRTTRPGFHGGRWVPPGTELIVTDQKPSKTWKLVEGSTPAEAPAAETSRPGIRPSDAES